MYCRVCGGYAFACFVVCVKYNASTRGILSHLGPAAVDAHGVCSYIASLEGIGSTGADLWEEDSQKWDTQWGQSSSSSQYKAASITPTVSTSGGNVSDNDDDDAFEPDPPDEDPGDTGQRQGSRRRRKRSREPGPLAITGVEFQKIW